MTAAPGPKVPPQRLAAGYFLAFCVLALVVVAVLRGAGRVVLPLLLVAGLGVLVVRVVRKVREPLP